MSVKSLDIQYFAILRDESLKDSEQVRIEISTVGDLYEVLKSQYGFSLSKDHIQFAVNDEFTPSDTVLKDGDKIVFIPPVAGG